MRWVPRPSRIIITNYILVAKKWARPSDKNTESYVPKHNIFSSDLSVKKLLLCIVVHYIHAISTAISRVTPGHTLFHMSSNSSCKLVISYVVSLVPRLEFLGIYYILGISLVFIITMDLCLQDFIVEISTKVIFQVHLQASKTYVRKRKDISNHIH